MSEIFLKEGKELFDNQFISVTQVKVSPDLGFVRFYLSFMQAPNPQETLNLVRQYNKELRQMLAKRIRNIVRKIPEVEFYYDDTMDVAENIDAMIRGIHNQPKSTQELNPDDYDDTLDVK